MREFLPLREYTRLLPSRTKRIYIETYIRANNLRVLDTSVYPKNGGELRTEEENASICIAEPTAPDYRLVKYK